MFRTMNTIQKIIIYITSALIVTTIMPFGSSFAQTSQTELSPTSTELSFSKGGESRSIELTIKNDNRQAITYKVSVVDFEPTDNGQPKLLFGDEHNLAYSLKDWFEPQPDLTVPAQSTKKVSLKFTVPEDAKDQTYYGSVLFSPNNEDGKDYSLDTGVASLLFVNVGAPAFSAQIPSFSASKASLQNNQIATEFSVKLFNTGNYKFTPQIYVDVLDPTGKPVDTFDFKASGSILPNSGRTYTAKYSGDLDSATIWSFIPIVSVGGKALVADKAVEFYSPEAVVPTLDTKNEESGPTVPASPNILLTAIIIGIGFATVLGATLVIMYKNKRSRLSEKTTATSVIDTLPSETPPTQASPTPNQQNPPPHENS